MNSGFIYNSAVYYLPQFFQAGLGYSPIRSGVFLLPVLVSMTVASLCSVSHLHYLVPKNADISNGRASPYRVLGSIV